MNTPEVSEEHFAFGQNWIRYSKHLTEEHIRQAEHSLRVMLPEGLAGKRFLDAGCGSGVFSIAAQRLGATVHAFDYDTDCVACTNELRKRFGREPFPVEQGSLLDPEYLARLGQFDVVYSWGVLPLTGNLWKGCETLVPSVGGKLFISIYNNQGWRSGYWTWVKRTFNKGPVRRLAMIALHAPYFLFARYLWRLARRSEPLGRGMTLWYDMIDWLGGYPFETATPQQVQEFFAARGLRLESSRLVGRRLGCNEFVFTR